MFLLIFNDPGDITAAPAAFPREYQHARDNPGGDIGDSCHIPWVHQTVLRILS